MLSISYVLQKTKEVTYLSKKYILPPFVFLYASKYRLQIDVNSESTRVFCPRRHLFEEQTRPKPPMTKVGYQWFENLRSTDFLHLLDSRSRTSPSRQETDERCPQKTECTYLANGPRTITQVPGTEGPPRTLRRGYTMVSEKCKTRVPRLTFRYRRTSLQPSVGCPYTRYEDRFRDYDWKRWSSDRRPG